MKKIFDKENRTILLNTLLLVFLMLGLFFLRQSFPLTHFQDRFVSNIALYNKDTPLYSKYFILTYLVVFPLLLFGTYQILSKLYKKTNEEVRKCNEKISIFGLVSYGLGFFLFLRNADLFSSFFLAALLGGITVLNLLLSRRNYSFERFQWSLLIAIPNAVVITYIVHILHLDFLNRQLLFIGFYWISALFFYYSSKKCHLGSLSKSFLFYLAALILHPLFLEFYNICNQHHIFIPHKSLFLVGIYGGLLLISLIYYHFQPKEEKFKTQKYYYMMLIIGLSLLLTTNPLVNIINTDFFESANHGISIYEFFHFGKIPIIETFDAHLFSSELLGFLYGFLNQDFFGAIFSLYDSYKFVLLFVLIYMILKEFIGREDAFLSILTLPFLMDTSLMSNFIGILALLALLNVIKKKTFASYLLLWISLALICLYRLDIGFASTLSAIVLLGYLWITNRKTYDLKKMMLSLFLVLLPFACFFFGVCFLKNINPLLRIIEFLKISLSNNNWAYSAFGSPSTYAYYLFYYIMPIAVLLSLFYLLAKKGKNLEKKDLILVFFALYFIFNFQRGLIRHSLVEKTMQGALSYFILYFSLFLSTLKPQAKARPVVAYACILILFSMTLSLDFINFNSLAIDVQSKELSYTLEDERQNSKVERIVLDKTMKKEYQNLKTVLSILLKENETYLDFTNQTLLYAILGYDNPVYINQSPGLLSGEYTQQLFLEEIKNYQGNVPIALKVRTNSDNQMNNFRITLDEVANEMRYYLVSEYIYQHYAYLGCVDDFEIWIEKERMEDAKKKLLQKQISLEQNEENQEEPYRLDYIPYIWGEMEKIQEKEIETVSLQTTASSISFKVHPTLPKEKGNYLLFQITNQGALSKETISLQSLNKTLSQIDFYVLPGTHTYKIRISSIKSWYEDDLDTITFTKKEDYEMTKLVIAEGDTLKQIN